MSDSKFWRNLASEFRALDPHGALRADWDYIVSSGDLTGWRLAGADHTLRVQFEALARRAGSASADRSGMDLLIVWFDALRRESPNFEYGAYLTEMHDDGTDGPHHQLGTIPHICVASADYCNVLESRAVDAEHVAKIEQARRSDPRNWSPLRQQWEAYKAIKELVHGPHEEIPESLVRMALAQQYGISPEEVTSEQIRFEVSGLLRDYPAIRLIPSQPVEEPRKSAVQPKTCVDAQGTANLDRRVRIDQFLEACQKFSQARLTRKHLWRAAGHRSGRQFEYWQNGSEKATGEDNRNFERILAMSPKEFVIQLRRRKILPEHQ